MTDSPRSQQQEYGKDAAVVSRHLPTGYTAEPYVLSGDHDQDQAAVPSPDPSQPAGESSLKLLGGDIHRDLFKIDAKAKLRQRAASFSGTLPRRSYGTSPHVHIPTEHATSDEQQAPGGFRREFLKRQHRRFHSVTAPVTKNFVSFLDLYGGFAGEDLFDSDDESEAETAEYEERAEPDGRPERSNEGRPLLGRRKSSRASKTGDAGTVKSFFTLLKAFVGTGILFLPKAFNNGGLLFSSITLVTISVLSSVCFHLLLQCRKRYGGGYGELGETIGGPWFRSLILASIAISQLGFVCAGVIFTAENLYSFLDAVTPRNTTPLPTSALIALQAALLIPLAFIRNISKLGPAALLADVFIFIGLTYIYYYDISTIAANGIHPTVVLFNPTHFTLTVGSAIFTFEGIGLILPIQSSMAHPEMFSRLLYLVMFIITIVFASVGFLSYATFGDNTLTEVISNFPQDSKLVNAVQFLYSLAVLVGLPVQLFPALRIMEGKLFGRMSGKRDRTTKWKKNAFRTGVVALCVAVSILGASDLDKFVALIGSFACVPLVYIYPAYLHYKGIASSRLVAGGDILLMLVGLAAMVYTTGVTVVRWTQE